MSKKSLLLVVVLLVLGLAGIWFLTEGDTTPPEIILQQKLDFIGKNQEFTFFVEDNKSGIMFVRVSIRQEGREVEILRVDIAKEGVRKKEFKLNMKPKSLGLKDGAATLIISAKDHSLFDNEIKSERKVTIDTHPPVIEIRSSNHYVNIGGSCLVLYSVSKDAVTSGILVGDIFFKGYPLTKDRLYAAYFALPSGTSTSTPIVLLALDNADNSIKISFPYLIRKKKFKKVKLNISDSFLAQKMPQFTNRYDDLGGGSNLDVFLEVNRRLRQDNNLKIKDICIKSNPKRLWEGSFLRMKGSEMAKFADKRTYYHNGKVVDKQVHMGVDIAAIKRYPIKATNTGIVVFADYIGIYGNTIIIDHGQGLFSMYSHLSSFKVKPKANVKKGDVIGNTGTTGLAGGDHLHFGIIVQHTYVNPKEWWDPHWIKDNITAKLQLHETN